MGQLEREVAQRRGQRKLDAMRRRTGQLRRRVIVTAIVGFVMLWTVVFVQMATGNDPALGTGAAARSTGKRAAPDPERRSFRAAVPPPKEDEGKESPATEEPETSEATRIESEQAEAERVEAEQQEAEVRELEELEVEAVTTGQS